MSFQSHLARVSALLLLALVPVMAAPSAEAQQFGGRVANARPGDVRVLMSNGLRVPFEAVKAQAEGAVGHPILVEYGASRGLQSIIESLQPIEVVVMTPDMIDEMIAKGRLAPGSRVDLARVKGAISQRGGDRKRDISAPETLTAALLGAKNVRFFPTGAVRPTVERMFAVLGVGEALKGRVLSLRGPAAPDVTLGPGEFELIINLDSELLTLPADEIYLGPVPQTLQVPVWMSAGVGVGGDPAAARALIAFLKGPAIDPALAAARMSR